MKKYIKILLYFIPVTLFLNSCNDNFFEQVPNDRISIEEVFQKRSYSEEFLTGVYSYIKEESHRTQDTDNPWDPCSDDLDVLMIEQLTLASESI